MAASLVRSGVRPNTDRTYTSAQKQFISFCDKYALQSLPSSEETLLMYVAFLQRLGLRHTTVRVYLAAVRYLHILEGYPSPLEGRLRLNQALKALQLNGEPPKQKCAITVNILSTMHNFMTDTYSDHLYWAAMTLAYFGCLRSSEFTVPGACVYDARIHLSIGDVTFHTLTSGESYVQVLVKRSKTDKTNRGFKVFIGCSQKTVCGYCALQKYTSLRLANSCTGAYFQFPNGCILTKSLFVKQTKLLVSLVGLPVDQYSGHSYRSGSATSGAAAGLADWEIKMLGRWSSDAYQRYIRTPVPVLVGFAKRLADDQVVDTLLNTTI